MSAIVDNVEATGEIRVLEEMASALEEEEERLNRSMETGEIGNIFVFWFSLLNSHSTILNSHTMQKGRTEKSEKSDLSFHFFIILFF